MEAISASDVSVKTAETEFLSSASTNKQPIFSDYAAADSDVSVKTAVHEFLSSASTTNAKREQIFPANCAANDVLNVNTEDHESSGSTGSTKEQILLDNSDNARAVKIRQLLNSGKRQVVYKMTKNLIMILGIFIFLSASTKIHEYRTFTNPFYMGIYTCTHLYLIICASLFIGASAFKGASAFLGAFIGVSAFIGSSAFTGACAFIACLH
jgi:hypothetical protein